MNNLLLFIVGFLVSSVVMVAIGVLVYAAILDGRYGRESLNRPRVSPPP